MVRLRRENIISYDDNPVRLNLEELKNNKQLFESLVKSFMIGGEIHLAKSCFDLHREEELILLLAHPDHYIRVAVEAKLEEIQRGKDENNRNNRIKN